MGQYTGGWAPTAPTHLAVVLAICLPPLVVGCTSVLPEPAGSLSSYQRLEPSDGLLTKSQISVDKDGVLAAGTVRIIPTTFSPAASDAKLTDAQMKLIGNAIDRSLCVGLSRRFQIVAPVQPADLTVHASVTRIVPTDEIAATASSVTSIGMTVVKATGVVTAPIPSVRFPIGLGGLALEAEAVDPAGGQKAAIIWGRGADSFTTRARASKAGDAYELASAFGADVSKLLVTGESPFKRKLPTLPSPDEIQSTMGGAHKEAACEAFGRGPGVPGLVGGAIGLPPEVTDKGAPTNGSAN
jgi:hypothetical protein